MGAFGFTFEALYRLQREELQDLARLIKGQDYFPPRTKEALIRGVIIPFLRQSSNAPKAATKDQVMRAALVRVARSFKVSCEDWDTATTEWMMRQVRSAWQETFRRRFDELSEHERDEILRKAEEELKKRAQRMGVGLLPAAGVIAGEMSGFGIYLATTTGLGAISTAIGVTFPWAIYQGATTLLGVMLGPVGWVMAGAVGVASGVAVLWQWFRRGEGKLKVVVLTVIQAIGDDPYEWFGVNDTASIEEIKTTYRAMMKTFHPDVRQKELPDWLLHRFNELLLRTQEHYERIQMHQEEKSR
jgi:DnaJ-domain-containing protein 1